MTSLTYVLDGEISEAWKEVEAIQPKGHLFVKRKFSSPSSVGTVFLNKGEGTF